MILQNISKYRHINVKRVYANTIFFAAAVSVKKQLCGFDPTFPRHSIKQYKYQFENANYDVGHTYGIDWIWN